MSRHSITHARTANLAQGFIKDFISGDVGKQEPAGRTRITELDIPVTHSLTYLL